MLVFIFWFFSIVSVHGRIPSLRSASKEFGKCANRTCIYGKCINNACICDAGVTGDKCNMDIIDCEPESCLNNGTCIELMNGFACQCLPDFDGPRCQHRRTINDDHCKKKCFHNGKCIVINNTEKCSCSSKYYGSECEYQRNTTNSYYPIRKCSLIKFRSSGGTATCLAIGLTPLFDVYCECRYNEENKQFVHCQITPSPYSKQNCFFKTPVSASTTLSALHDPVLVHVCPVNWQILDQYENTGEFVNNVHTTRCELL